MRSWLKKIGTVFNKKEVSDKPEPEVKQTEPEVKNSQSEIKQTEPQIKISQPEIKQSEPEVKTSELTKTKTDKDIKKSWFNKLGDNFKKTSSNIKNAIFSKKLDKSSLEDIEEAFILSDLGINYTKLLIDELSKRKIDDNDINIQVANFLESQFTNINHEFIFEPEKTRRVILVFGVNGSGKTTTIA